MLEVVKMCKKCAEGVSEVADPHMASAYFARYRFP